MKKRILCLLLCCVMLFGMLPFSVFAVSVVDKVSLTLDFPLAGKEPPGTATWHTAGYSIHAIDWLDRETGEFLEPGEKIQAGHAYTAQLWVEADRGYEFNYTNDNTPNISAVVNGTSCSVSKAYEYKAFAMVVVEYSFSSVPAKGWISSVDLTVEAPVAGKTASYTRFDYPQYASKDISFNGQTDQNMKNGIAWYATADQKYLRPGNAVFEENTSYTLLTLIAPKEGYRFTPNAAVRVNGKAAPGTLDYDTFLAVSYRFPATGVVETVHRHTPSAWRTTQVYHYKVCTTCGEMLVDEDHSGGTISCAEPAVCAVCGYTYAEATEDHTPDTSKWIARGDMYHYHKCKLCGAHCDIGDHVAGPAGTPGAAVVCRDCGFTMTPAKDHTHKLTKVEKEVATCSKEGMLEHYTCSGCSDLFADANGNQKRTVEQLTIPVLEHKTDLNWTFDELEHWKVCTECGIAVQETRAEHDSETSCSICGYPDGFDPHKGEKKTPNSGFNKTPDPGSDPGNEPGGFDWLLIALIGGGALLLAAVSGLVVFLLLRKKKPNNS